MSEVNSLPEGIKLWSEYLSLEQQQELVSTVREAVRQAPLFVPRMPKTGKEMSVRMTNMGPLGWVTDQADGYRYQAMHPETEKPWPILPPMLLSIWAKLADFPHPPEACLVNYYEDNAKMGLHQDRDEKTFDAPVLSISLGNDCLFRIGGTKRGGKTQSVRLRSGDVISLSGPARLAYHGVDRIYPDTSDLLKNGGRINLTMRRVNEPKV